MRIIITSKTKNHNPSEKEIDKTVDIVMEIVNKLEEYDIVSYKCYKDGTSVVMETK